MFAQSIIQPEGTMGLQVSEKVRAIASGEAITSNEALASHETIANNEVIISDDTVRSDETACNTTSDETIVMIVMIVSMK